MRWLQCNESALRIISDTMYWRQTTEYTQNRHNSMDQANENVMIVNVEKTISIINVASFVLKKAKNIH